MVFNWFRRKYADQAQPSQVQKREPEADQETGSSPQPQTVTPEDYLQWAKAAYQNIQKQQEEAGVPIDGETVAVEISTEETGVGAGTDAQLADVEDGGAIPSSDEVLVPSKSTIPTAQPPQETTVATAESELAVPDPNLPPAEVQETALPFWSRAEGDKQSRMERLRSLATEELEPEPEHQSAITTDPALDEGFLWSAEVLAAQGRRPEDVSLEEITWLQQLRQGLTKTRRSLINQLKAIVGQGPLNQAAVLEIEELLLQADVGVEATDTIVTALQSRLREETLPPEAAIRHLKTILREILDQPLVEDYSPTFVPTKETLNIWLIAGVNGAGKTTTIGKIAHLASKSGYRCLIAAADTFRAAAVQQVQVWGDRSGVAVIANSSANTDPAAVVYDAIAAAQARDSELLLIDTAGRLQNKQNLMAELSKIRQVIDKKAIAAQVESLLVLDATLGQNGLRQAEVFADVAKLSGVVLTKLDGSARGGVALGVVQQLGIPIRFLGAGEGIEDLRPFSSYEFVEALLSG